MHSTAAAISAAVVFVWLGMVLAISFIEAPIKFRAPGVTIPIGLGIGRLVFRALNMVEIALAVTVAVCAIVGHATTCPAVLTAGAAVMLAAQLIAVRPALNRRSDRVLAGEDLPHSRQHFVYVGLEIAKVVFLIALGISVLPR